MRALVFAAIAGALLLATPLATAFNYKIGDAGNTTGIRVDAGLVYVNCGRGNKYGNPSVDVIVDGKDNTADNSFQRQPFSIVPDACLHAGEWLAPAVPQ
jgi:hypothetical protein